MQNGVDIHQRIARISAHLNPSSNNFQVEGSSSLWREDCRANGGSAGFKVAILGAAGGIGQPLALLMKMNPLVSVLHLYDVVNTPGVTADISHMDTGAVECDVDSIKFKGEKKSYCNEGGHTLTLLFEDLSGSRKRLIGGMDSHTFYCLFMKTF